jgi:hypothetical protein
MLPQVSGRFPIAEVGGICRGKRCDREVNGTRGLIAFD